MWTRRSLLHAAVLAPFARVAHAKDAPMLMRTIPSSGEQVPAIGLGSWQTFDVSDVAPLTPVLARFFALGGRIVDSSPMYGKAEGAIGKMLAAIRKTEAVKPFLATKVWTSGKTEGIAQMERSLALLGDKKIALMQIHNLVDWQTQLATLRAWKAAGTIQYIGITHYAHSAFGELEKIVKTEKVDFIQLPYSVRDRAAEARLLPAAKDHGVAVLVMRPFAEGDLFASVKGRALPAVASELGATSWGQLFLKFLLGHPAVTCPIPATSKIKHVEDNLGALHGAVPDEAQRKAILAALG